MTDPTNAPACNWFDVNSNNKVEYCEDPATRARSCDIDAPVCERHACRHSPTFAQEEARLAAKAAAKAAAMKPAGHDATTDALRQCVEALEQARSFVPPFSFPVTDAQIESALATARRVLGGGK